MIKKSEFDFLNEVFEWLFYNMPIHSDNSFVRTLFDFYKLHGNLTRRQLVALLKRIHAIDKEPPFNPATIEAIIRKMPVRFKSEAPVITPVYKEDTKTMEQVQEILAIAPTHKAALLYKNKLELNQPLTIAEKENINRFLTHLKSISKK
jgi:hypothetical protein